MVTRSFRRKSSVEIVGGQYKLSVDGKKMDSNENERGIHIKTSKDYLLDVVVTFHSQLSLVLFQSSQVPH